MMLGTEAIGEAADSLFLVRRTNGRVLARGLGAATARDAMITSLDVEALELDPRREPPPLREPGVASDRLPPAQRAALAHLVHEYAASLSDGTRCITAPGSLRFWWAGPRDGSGPHYYRVAGAGFVVEFLDHGGHLHSVVHTKDNFGRRASDRLASGEPC
jgi:hypothetical protein